ncbi:MAG: serine/threonine-protein kinase [Chloroflexaceae bacterium]
MAQVYKAEQPMIERLVAIKVLHSHLAESDDFVARFKREARGLGQLQHPHIVQVIDFDIEDNLYYMVVDYIPGQTLQTYLDEKKALPYSEALAITAQLADALAYAHSKDTIHRTWTECRSRLPVPGMRCGSRRRTAACATWGRYR